MYLERKCLKYIYIYNKKRRRIRRNLYMQKKTLSMCRLNNTTHDYPIGIMVKSSNHMFAYSFFFSLSISCLIYFIVDYYYYYNDAWLLYGRLFVLMCTNHNPSSASERRRKRISFFFLSQMRKERRERTVAGEHFYSFLDLSYVVHNNLPTFPQ